MSIALVSANGAFVWRIFVRSNSLRSNRAVTGAVFAPVRPDILARQPLDALGVLGLTDERDMLARQATDWRWLTNAEMADAIDADAKLLKEFV